MHIAFITPEYPHSLTNSSGGLGTSIKNLAHSLIHQGVEVSIFIYAQDQNKTFKEDKINFYLIKQKSYKFGGFYFYRKYLQQYINKKIKEESIDLLEAPDWTGITAFMKFNCPLVIRLNGSDGYFCHLENRDQKPKNRFFEKRALRAANAIVSVSAFTAKVTSEIFKLEKKISVIPNSLDPNNFMPSSQKVDENLLLYFGTIIRKKGVLELAGIFNKVVQEKPNAKLLLLGKDVVDVFTNKSTLELFITSLSKEAKSMVEHLQEVKYSNVKNYIASAKVILLPSFAEALPMTWLEAMSMEKALVTSNVGWASEVMIDGKTGFTVDPKNHASYASKIVKLMNDDHLNEQMGKAARKQVLSKFSTDVVVLQNIEFYRKIILDSKG